MNTPINTTGSTIIPSLRYRNALAAIDWLVTAFGLKKQAVFVAPDNKTVQHAQLTLGPGMIMIGSVDNGGEAGKFMAQPDEIGFRETQGAYLVVPDADAIYATAKAAGAEMIIDIRDMDYGGRHFSCRDLEGHMWGIGTYNPWQQESSQPKPESAIEHAQESARR
ncbi:VOC family protein [Tunturibacter empetritectus]|uniref:Glyoxalase superfamily protein PhnB n=1 Tax=Tunturiibacter lichenicola TaxID=2051959 RepID=A0A7W8J3Z3_9BACT|nr:VOC family protein [Edaphobacter lichenicola]MBB5342085.1 putative glyoxalase superfamily protein PhnB [Edaphobacter lichenicola]